MEMIKENRKTKMLALDLIALKKRVTDSTTNLPAKGMDTASETPLKVFRDDTTCAISKHKKQAAHFKAMVKWYRKELRRNLFGVEIINPPADWSEFQQEQPYQLHFGTLNLLKEEYAAHISHGYIEVSPTAQVPQIHSSVSVEIFLPGQDCPEKIKGTVMGHIAGGFNVQLMTQDSFVKKVEQFLQV